jgi:hypothetical protein
VIGNGAASAEVPMLMRIASILAPMVAIVAVGYLYGRFRKPNMAIANQLALEIFIPALVIATLADKSFELRNYLPLALGGAAVILGSGLLAWPLCRWLGVAPRTFLPAMMFNNSGNLGLPLIVLAFGPAALAPAMVLWLVETMLHFSLGAWMVDRHSRLRDFWRIPVVIATAIGLTLNFTGTEIWPPLHAGAKMLGDISVPLLLFVLGARLVDADFSELRLGLWGSAVCPLVGMASAAIAAFALGLSPEQSAILLIFGALPPAVLNYVFAERYKREPHKVASIVFTGNLASLAVLPLALLIVLR